MTTPTYLFYDLETSGLNKCFDQIFQFAAIRTDLNFNEIERHEIRVKLNSDVIPAPGAVITHRMSMAEMLSGESEIEAIVKIHSLINQPGTISLGYNTLGFDDEFLRFTFFRYLLPPYTHQYANNCKRMDIYPILIMYYLYQPDILNWPTKDGKISLKLENIAEANAFNHGAAHNAIVDVEVTLELARRLHQQRDMWNYVTGFFDKLTDQKRLQQLPYSFKIADFDYQEGLVISGKLGSDNYYQAPVVYLGPHHHYRNQTLWLRLDNEKLSLTTPSTIFENTYVLRKRFAEQPFLLPPHARFLKYLNEDRLALTESNKIWLRKHAELFDQIRTFHQEYKYPAVPARDSQAALYDLGFPTPLEEKLYQQFHCSTPAAKPDIVMKIIDPCRRELGLRILARHYPECLSPENLDYYRNYRKALFSGESAPTDFRGEKQLTPAIALQQISELQQTHILDNVQIKLLEELKNYLQDLIPT